VVAGAFAETLAYVHVTGSGWTATLLGAALTIVAATGLFLQLQISLNAIWGDPAKPGNSLLRILRKRFTAFATVVGIGVLLLLLLVANAVVVAMRASLRDAHWATQARIWSGAEWFLLFVLLVLLFAMIYKLLPDVVIPWREVWIGALITALLFVVGNYLIGYFMGRIAPTFAYWAASSLVVVMLWVYYSSQTLLFGAELTKNLYQWRRDQPALSPLHRAAPAVNAGVK
jgi:membrane protein